MAISSLKRTEGIEGGGDELLELDDICRLTKQSKTSIYRQGKAGQIPKPKKLPSGAIRWTRASYRKWVERLPEAEWSELDEAESEAKAPEAA